MLLKNLYHGLFSKPTSHYMLVHNWSDPGGGGGGYLSHTCISFTGMCRLNGFGVWCRFGRKMGIDFVHFGLELGMVFKGTVEVYEHIIVLIPNG